MYKIVLFTLDMHVNERYFIRISDPALTSRTFFLHQNQLNGLREPHSRKQGGSFLARRRSCPVPSRPRIRTTRGETFGRYHKTEV